MFSQVLGKPMKSYDISVFENYSPETIMDYHHHSDLEITLDIYWQLKDANEDPENPNQNVKRWVHFFDEILEARSDLNAAPDNPKRSRFGPYYYPPTNTVIFFTTKVSHENPITSEDILYLHSLAEPPVPNERVGKYYQSLKR